VVRQDKEIVTPIDAVQLQVLQQLRGHHCHGLHGPVAVLLVEEDHSREQEVMEEFKQEIVILTSALLLIVLKNWRFGLSVETIQKAVLED